jgi:hypothetical protein
MAELAAMLAEMALAVEQRCHEAATRENALADKANKRCCHETATQEKVLADNAESQGCQVLAKRAALLAESVSAKEQRCQELVDCAAVLAEMTLAKKCRHREVAESGAMLRETALAKEQLCSLLAEQATEPELAAAQVAVLVDLALPKPALAEDKQHQEKAATEQCWADNDRFMVPIMLLDPVDVAIWRIQADCALRAAPLDAILAKIECNDIAHEARAPLMTTSPHPLAMLSTAPCPMTYVGAALPMMGEEHSCNVPCSGTIGSTPLPTIDGQLWTVRQRARLCHRTGHCHRPCAPSPPDKVLPSHPHPTVEGLSTPAETPNLLARATLRSGMPSLAPSLTASSTPYLLPFTFGSKVCLSLEGVVAHPFCAGGLTPPPQKRSQRKHQPCCAGRRHGPRAPNPQEHLLPGRQHQPRAPNQSTSNGWA